MQMVKKVYDTITTKILTTGLYFVAILTPGRVTAQGGGDDGLRRAFDDSQENDIQPGSVAEDLLGSDGVFQTVANILLIIIGAVAVIMLIVGGFRYVVSGGDSNAVESAKNTILYAIIGIVVAFLAYAAINFLTGQLTQGV